MKGHLWAALALALLVTGCPRVRVVVDPIRITVDVNVRVDRELDRFFAFEDEAEKKVEKAPTGGTK